MALVDMKSNLALGAGKPLGNPKGRHDPNPDLKKSTLDDGSGIVSLTNPGGRHFDGPINPVQVPNVSKSKLDIAVSRAKTKGMDYLMQKVKSQSSKPQIKQR